MKSVLRYLTGCCATDGKGDNDGVTKIIMQKIPTTKGGYHIKKDSEFLSDENQIKSTDNPPRSLKFLSVNSEGFAKLQVESPTMAQKDHSDIHLNTHDVNHDHDDMEDEVYYPDTNLYGAKLLNASPITRSDIKAVFT